MTVKGYPKYRESGIDWLGPVPAHWTVAPLKVAFEVRLGKMLQPERSSETDHLAFYLRAANIQWAGVETTDLKQMWFSPAEKAQLRLRHGDLLISEGGDVGRSAVWDLDLEECYFQNSINRVRPRLDASTRFLYYWMSTIKDKGYIDVLCNKSTIAHFTAEKVQAVPTPLPPTSEQTAIADFLDRETGKIDALVEEQRRLIGLLKEKRQTVVSHAVTKGLNPNAKMKHSRVEWTGEVPQHWDLVPLKFLATIGNGSTPNRDNAKYWEGGTYPWLNSSVVNSDVVYGADQFVTETALRECHLPIVQPPAILVGITGQGRTRGMASLLMVEATINQHVAYIKPTNARTSCAYLLEFFGAAYEHLRTDSEAAGSTKGAITCEQLSRLVVPLPPVTEQLAICEALSREKSRLGDLIAAAEEAVQLLLERRAAVISAAVTGKFDIREAPSFALTTAPDVGRVRLLVAAEIVDLLSHKKAFGRVKLQKLLYLAEADVGIAELQGQYLREAAGPLDRALIAEAEAGLQEDQHVTVAQPDGAGSQVLYHLLGEPRAYHDELVAAVGERAAALDNLIGKVGDLDTKSVEAVTTLYAVWNDALIDHLEPTDEAVVSGVLEDWHPE